MEAKETKEFMLRHLMALSKIEKKLKDVEAKLDHVLFRLIEEDPRIYKKGRFSVDGNGNNVDNLKTT